MCCAVEPPTSTRDDADEDFVMAHVLPWPWMRDARGNVVLAWERPILMREAGDSDDSSADDKNDVGSADDSSADDNNDDGSVHDNNDDDSAPSIYECSGPDNEGSVPAPPDSEEDAMASTSNEAMTDYVVVDGSDMYRDDGYDADTEEVHDGVMEEVHDGVMEENIVGIEASGYHAERSCFLERDFWEWVWVVEEVV